MPTPSGHPTCKVATMISVIWSLYQPDDCTCKPSIYVMYVSFNQGKLLAND